MDFRQITQPSSSRPTPSAPEPEVSISRAEKTSRGKTKGVRWVQIFTGIMLIGIALLVACVALAINRGSTSNNEHQYVDTGKYQAVFLNNGQVYFGNVTALNNDYVRLTNVYYLTQGDSTNTSSYTLVKLGCQQIHDPYDAMVINRTQVTFWENLQNDGKVVSSIKEFKKQNPNGPDCTQVSSQTQASNSASTQGSTSGSTNSNGSPSTK